MALHEAKQMLDQLYGLCDKIDETPAGIKYQSDGFTLRKALYVEMLKYIMYLSASDGSVAWREANFISELFDVNLTPDEVKDFIRENNIYSVEFERTVPLTLKSFVKADKMLVSSGVHSDSFASKILVGFYEAVGKEIVLSDMDVAENEKADYNIYMRTLKDYLQKELLDHVHKKSPTQNTLKSHYDLLKKTDK